MVINIELIQENSFENYLANQNSFIKNWIEQNNFEPKPQNFIIIPQQSGEIEKIICIISEKNNFWDCGNLPSKLPSKNTYEFKIISPLDTNYINSACVAWELGCYSFNKYKNSNAKPKLINNISENNLSIINGINLTRDLINTPCEDLGPEELAQVAQEIANKYKANINIISGDDLLENNFPCIHTVGRASSKQPKLIDLQWGEKNKFNLVLIGKGVCFDSGGLNLKPGNAMALMKKDMGGAAHVLGLGQMIMDLNLPINLRIVIPAVENAVSSNAFRPSDVITARNGLSIEVGNTDGEGRLILADCLSYACEDKNKKIDLLIDFATLTGAARVAVGTELPAVFSNRNSIASELVKLGEDKSDPVWQLPLHQPYKSFIQSDIADLRNDPSTGMGGSITAGLFLENFVDPEVPWVHIDLMAWNTRSRPGRPKGGEAMGLMGVLAYISQVCENPSALAP